MNGDLDAQRDELEALQSIYTEYEFRVSSETSGQFFAELALPPDYMVEAQLEEDGAPEESFIVRYLPPLVLYFTLPANYPSQEKPQFLLSCKWLTRDQLSKVCQHLDKLWDENKGMEVLFTWTQFLKEETLTFMNCEMKLDVSSIYKRQATYAERKKAMRQRFKPAADSDTECSKLKETPKSSNTPETGLQVNPQICTKCSDIDAVQLSEAANTNVKISSESNDGIGVNMQATSESNGENNTQSISESSGGNENNTRSTSDSSDANKNDSTTPNQCSDEVKTITQPLTNDSSDANEGSTFGQSTQARESGIKSECLDGVRSLGVSRTKLGKKRGNNTKPDKRAVLDLPMTEPICEMLREFDKQQEEVVFERSLHDCLVCFRAKPGYACLRFKPCGHVFCAACCKEFFDIQVKEGNVRGLRCLQEKCMSEAMPSQVRQVLSDEMFAKYDKALLAATLDMLSDIVYCPRRDCQYPVSVDTDETMGRCPSCLYVFCIYCKMTYHGIEPCKLKSEVSQRLVQEYVEGSQENREQLEKRYGKKQLQNLVDTALTEQWVSSNSQNCPNCNVSIEKSAGCNKMVCWKCGVYFCWLCLSVVDHALPYLHYNVPGNSCYNRLFEGVAPEDMDEAAPAWYGGEAPDYWFDMQEF